MKAFWTLGVAMLALLVMGGGSHEGTNRFTTTARALAA